MVDFYYLLVYSIIRLYDKGGNIVKRTYKPSSSHFFAIFDSFRQNFDYKDGVLCIVAFIILVISTVFMSAGNPKVYIVKVNNKFIGYINKYDIYKSAINNIKLINKGASLKSVVVERTHEVANAFATETTIEKAINKELGFNISSVAVSANGTVIAIVSNYDDAKKVVEGIKKYYYPKISNGKITVTSSKIEENITTSDVNTEPKGILSVKDAIKKIVNGRGAEKSYAIKDGDTIWDIALANDLEVEVIQAANPKLNMDKIKIGQVIKLAVNMPYVNVKLTASVNSKEQIPFESRSVTNKKIRKGLKKVAQHGRNGLAEIQKNVTIINGNIINENITSNKTLYAAKDEIIIVGGMAPMYAASGTFMKPSRGRLSSSFGRRWGKMHEGIDLAGPTGSPIDAADSGKVSFVGIRNGYGLCVMINHGNGLQTLYGHTSKTFVKSGQSVKKGQRIASIGSTGHSTGPHLHFEVRKNGVPVNPLVYLRMR